MAGALLAIEDLRVAFHTAHGTVQAVDGVSLSVAPGETVAVVGESGSGKSVTALSVLRLFGRADRVATEGAVRFAREGGVVDLLRLDETAMRAIRGGEIAIVFQDPSTSLNPVFPIGAQIAEVLRRHRGLGRREAFAEAARLLGRVGIAEPEARLRAYPHQLSGGMRQRAMIAMAIACDPRLLIADEPTTALDVTIQAQIVRLLKDIQGARGMGLMFITHDLELVGEIADRVVVMYAGQVVESGPAAAVLAAPCHPYTRALLACRPARDYAADGADTIRLSAIPGAPPRPGALPSGCRFAERCAMALPECRVAPVPLGSVAPGRAARCLRAGEVA
ncbi:ABC transporter ATP-binding protein [Elioraea sp. Yellowstone]|jgi:oligopeptide/dipeptide ABC transporter ATP-binding protein|uniref:ABC transporter ATP-binding protein n=1 Tax=Elioraea sp. Yellowstone TaxID=2592070 RepID=UPI001153D873|nr:ABC transporter ATP-binding protein [Elioraea sp. Yellowstone]TQF77525.1 ABC transporter ATP-binding protein [Elioraea sp. Yellowstone]